MRHSPHQLISGRAEPVPRSLMQQGEGTGLQGGWDHSRERRIAATLSGDHTSTLDSVMFLSSSFSEFDQTLRAAPVGTRPVSR
jgi:hypothetical protein